MERQYQCLRCGRDSRTHECEQMAHAKMVDLQRALDAARRERHAVEQIAGRALGYPRFADDQKNFPGATEADGVCVGEHVAVTIVQELADTLTARRAAQIEKGEKVKELEEQLRLANCDQVNTENDLNDVTSQLATIQAQLRHMTKERDIQKEVADNQAWHVRDLKAQLRHVEGELAAMKGATNASS